MVEPVGFRVLVKVDPVIEETQGGIVVVTDKKLEKNATVSGVVLAIGPEAFRSFNRTAGFGERYQPWINVGDHIYFAKYSGKWVVDPDDQEADLIMINDEDVIGRIRGSHSDVVAS